MSIYRLQKDSWYLERFIFFIGGSLIMITLLLGYFISQYIYLFTFIIGALMLFFSLTGFCPMAILLDKFGIKSRLKSN